MTISSFSIDRLTIVSLAMAAMLPFVAISPVKAATSECATQVAALRSEAATAAPQQAAKALRTAAVAEQICAEGNRHEALKKLAQAREALADTVQLAERR